VTRLAVDDPQDVFGIDGYGDGIFECAVDDGRDPATDADTPRLILAAAGTRLGSNNGFYSQLPISLLRKSVLAKLRAKSWVAG
jgi:hypothetical protein